MLKDYIVASGADSQEEEVIDLDYEFIYGGIIDMILSEVSEKGGNTDYFQYTFYDIDKDGYLEFIMEKGTCEADMVYEVYSTNENVALPCCWEKSGRDIRD